MATEVILTDAPPRREQREDLRPTKAKRRNPGERQAPLSQSRVFLKTRSYAWCAEQNCSALPPPFNAAACLNVCDNGRNALERLYHHPTST